MPIALERDVPLAPLTTFELGGPARFFARVGSEAELVEAVDWSGEQGLPLLILGGGSNLVIADGGFPGLVVRVGLRGVSAALVDDAVLVTASAGEPWDDFVAWTIAQGWAGLETLSGIPGLVGGTPIQNVGAYGQDVGQTIRHVRVFDRAAGVVVELTHADCGFAYRDSRLRKQPDRFVVLAVTFALRVGAPSAVHHPDLERELACMPPASLAPSLAQVRAAVIAVRRRKSMVRDPADLNHRSAGSFFTNPIVPAGEAERVRALAVARGRVERPEQVPCFAQPDGACKLAAAWLIETAGFAKGTRRGPVGLSSRHTLALVNHGGATTADLLAFAREVAGGVEAEWGVTLRPEPVFVGVNWP